MDTDFPLINAVLQKKQEGSIYNIGESSFIIHKSGFSYLKLGKENDLNSIFGFFSNEKKLPQYFHIYDPSVKLVEGIKNDKRFGIKYRKRIQLRFLNNKLKTKYSENLLANYKITEINNNNFENLRIFNLKLDNNFWESKLDFIKNGYGLIVVNEKNEPVSICYSSCIIDKIAEIDIATLPKYQGKGLAKAVAEAFIAKSVKKGIQANWDCFEENIPSLKTAQNVGFTIMKEYWFLSIYNKTWGNE